ncbi:iron chaperone [Flavobacterium sp. NKUCC04_CG]|uniref:iron chaperone n=1 Tax=Flavobacterium sp. NKUCC04_CG TaxID=2842121 RepID=UPI001C5AE9B0|nr:DUF1801 domain-containing protein [Flavobacterium sp. NKUCC04_CG]MBW3518611.1 DUF1801 domain-containing protein [Flavobacterium sp. NKUCC04_CG]
MTPEKYTCVDQYINGISSEYFDCAIELRNIIKSALPQAEEVISYNMPAYRYRKILVFFAVYPSHIGFYPTPSAITAFKDDLSTYKCSKGTINSPMKNRFPKR